MLMHNKSNGQLPAAGQSNRGHGRFSRIAKIVVASLMLKSNVSVMLNVPVALSDCDIKCVSNFGRDLSCASPPYCMIYHSSGLTPAMRIQENHKRRQEVLNTLLLGRA
jgi:hypothetical protein